MKHEIKLKRKTYEQLQQTVIELTLKNSLLEKALDKACDVIVELNTCNNLVSEEYLHCPLEQKCNNRCIEEKRNNRCISNKENWKEWCMKDV